MSRRVRPPAASAGCLPLAERPGRVVDSLPGGHPDPLPRVRRVRRWRWERYLVLAVAIYGAALGRREWVAYNNLHTSAVSLQRQAAALAAQHGRLAQEVSYAQSSAYVAAAAREEFGLVAPDQVPLAPVGVPSTGASATGSG